ncbi:transcriptional regulator SlyA [Oceanisphaera arctica]|uniref:MarR family transcriptional regulator n=1 Tax=Oceanisphaera arctica TaxID=641510 RepID=A0A2P5TLY2_9GAMM|nr:transcriptional regulator SlyA [Oceanisphaera arctica]PPL16372.1 MarR family transcriptional regulator [Oceanisphaera arctica]GHA14135.1 transcriptional regulator SlyA [Oceanisphaera arctica]
MKTLGMSLSCLVRQWRWLNDERLKPLGLTQSRWITLTHLKYEDGIQQHQLARRVGVESPSLVRTLDGLEQLGLVERRPCINDRRGKTVHLTAQVSPLMNEMDTILESTRNQVLAGLSEQEIREFSRVAEHINQNLHGLCGHKE